MDKSFQNIKREAQSDPENPENKLRAAIAYERLNERPIGVPRCPHCKLWSERVLLNLFFIKNVSINAIAKYLVTTEWGCKICREKPSDYVYYSNSDLDSIVWKKILDLPPIRHIIKSEKEPGASYSFQPELAYLVTLCQVKD